MKYFYARVSSKEQNLARQTAKAAELGIPSENVFCEKESGANENRPVLNELLSKLQSGDVLYVCSFDRLARSTKQLLDLSERFQQEGISLVSLAEGIDTTTPQGKLFFTISSAFAEFERNIIKERQQQGIAEAHKRGTRFGRPSIDADTMSLALEFYQHSNLSIAQICEKTGVNKSSLYRKLKELGIKRS